MLEGKDFLARTAQTDDHDISTRTANAFVQGLVLLVANAPELRSLDPREPQARKVLGEPLLHRSEDLGTAAVEIDRHAQLGRTPADFDRELWPPHSVRQ